MYRFVDTRAHRPVSLPHRTSPATIDDVEIVEYADYL
jgi:hypothetical protein